jgi:hypothetical protein
MHVIANGSRHANAPWRAFTLKPRCNIHSVTVQVRPVCDGIPDVDPDTEPDRPIWWLIAAVDWNSLLNPHGEAHCAVDTVENDEKRISPRLHDFTTVLLERWIDHLSAEGA